MNFSTVNTIGITGGIVAAIIGMSLGAMTAKADAASASPAALITAWNKADNVCRGSSNPAVYTPACERRDLVLDPKLKAIGWVYGWENVFGYCQKWHRPGEKPRSRDCYFPD